MWNGSNDKACRQAITELFVHLKYLQNPSSFLEGNRRVFRIFLICSGVIWPRRKHGAKSATLREGWTASARQSRRIVGFQDPAASALVEEVGVEDRARKMQMSGCTPACNSAPRNVTGLSLARELCQLVIIACLHRPTKLLYLPFYGRGAVPCL